MGLGQFEIPLVTVILRGATPRRSMAPVDIFALATERTVVYNGYM